MEVFTGEDDLTRLLKSALEGNSSDYQSFLFKASKIIEKDIYYRISDAQDREDCVQMSLLRVHQYLGSYSGSGSAKGWLRTIARNVVFDHYKKSGKGSFIQEMGDWNEDEYRDQNSYGPEDEASLQSSLSELGEENARLIKEYNLGGANISDLAKKEKVSVNNMKVRLHRAKKALKDFLK